ATSRIYPRSLHDALPILQITAQGRQSGPFLNLRWARTTRVAQECVKDLRIAHAHDGRLVRIEAEKAHEPNRFGRDGFARRPMPLDRKSTRLNSSHGSISH